jgi:dipeptidase
MEGFSISDASSGEVWYMEFIGKGGYGKGALWVALRLPEGHVMAHANQARLGIR